MREHGAPRDPAWYTVVRTLLPLLAVASWVLAAVTVEPWGSRCPARS